MPFSTGNQKVQTNLMKAYRRPRQYIFHHCQLGRMSPGLSLLVSVCVLMLPMLGLVDEHAQLTTAYHISPIHQCYDHPGHMTLNHTPLLLPSLNNVLPAMALQNRVARSIIGCPSYTSSHSGVHHRSPILHLILPTGLARGVVGVVLVLLLLLSGDIETNPGPVGQQLTVDDLRVVTKELNDVRAKWNNIGVHLGVSVGTLDAIEIQYSDPSDCLRRTLTTWLRSSTPTWANIVDALNVVGEVRLAAHLEHKYCSTQHIAATHQHTPPVPPVFASPYSVPPQPHPSHFPPRSIPYYHPPPTSYPVSTPSLPPPTSYPVSTPSLPPPTSYPVSTPSLPPSTSHPVSTPSLPPPTSYPVSTPSLPPPTSYPVSTPSLPPPTSYPLSTPSLPPPTSYPLSTPSLPPPTSYPVSTPSLPPPTSYPVSTPSLPPPTSHPLSTPSPPPPSPAAASTATSLSAYSQLPHITPDPTPSSPPTPVPVQPTNLPSDAVQSMIIPPDVAAGPGATRLHTVENQVQNFESKFSCLVDKAYQELKERIEPSDFLSCVTYLPSSARTLHRSFIMNNLANIPPPVTFVKIWTILNMYWDFLNYGLLEHVINKCGSEDLKQQMQDYVDELSTFKRETRLCDFIKSWPCRDNGPPEDHLKKVVVKMGHEWSQCTLHDLESFNKSLIHKFFLPDFDILLQKAERGLHLPEKYKSEDHYLSICPGATRLHTVENQVQNFESKFSCLVDKVYQEVNGRIEPFDFISHVTYLPSSARTLHRSFIENNLVNIQPPVTFQKIWSILNLYWDFLNYGLLEHVINKCESEGLKQQMQDYIVELSAFKQTTRLCDFIEIWPCRDDGPPEDHLKKVVVKMGHEWSQCTLHDLESFNKSLIHKFFLPDFDILLQKAVRGLHLPEKYKSEDHYLSICEQVMHGHGQMDQTVMHCIFVGPAGVGKSSLMSRLLHKKLHPKRTSTQLAEKGVQVKIVRDVSTAVAQVSGLQWQILEDPDTQAFELIRQLSTEQKNYAAVNEQVSEQTEDTTQVSGQLPTKKKANNYSTVTQTPGELSSIQDTSKGQFNKLNYFRHVLKERRVSELKHYINNPWTLYLTDSGGQPEFHELLPALVVGPSVFFVVFRLDQDLNEKYEVEYVRPDKRTIKYTSSLTLREDLMRSLASIASTKYLDICGKEVKPKVILVATFKDEVKQEEDCHKKLQQIQDLVKETDVFRDGMIVDASKTQMVFTINNISDEEAERDAKRIRNAIQVIGDGFKICTPSPWLIFNILVQHKHAHDSVISKDECFELAQGYGIREETEFEAALEFLHKQTGMLHYYKKPSELNQIVVRNPQHLFNRVNHLVEAFVFEKTRCSQHTNEFERGIFKRTVYETQTKEFSNSKLTPSMLLKLLEHLNVVVPLGDGEKYFMPCAIAHCDETTAIRSATIPPLLITFKSGYCPKGLFGSLVACIANKQVAGCTLNLDESHIHQDQICFTMGQYSLLLRVYPTFIYIEVIPSNPDTPLSAFCTPCNSVCKLILENLNEACKTLRYSDNANYFVSFECPCNQQQKFHPAVLRDDLNSCFWCTQSKKAVNVKKECYVWLPQPTIIPESQSVASGSVAEFTVKATGDVLQFQWQKNGSDIHHHCSRYRGTDTDTLCILMVERSDEGCYRCLVKNYIGGKFSNDVVLTVSDPPKITQHPKRQSVVTTTSVAFSVEATGDDLQFQWQKNCVDLCDGDRYCGTETDYLHILMVERTDEGRYRCLVKNSVGEKFSNNAILTVRGTQLHPAGPVYNPPAMSAPQQTNIQNLMQMQQPQIYQCTNYPQVQRPGHHLPQQGFVMPLQPTLQQLGTNGTSLQSTSHPSFAPSPRRPKTSTYERPDLLKLLSFPGKGGNKINIPVRIGTKYLTFGILLLNDTTGAEVKAIIKEHRENAAEINLDILTLWIEGKGKPLSWDTLINVLQSIGLGNLAGDIEDGLHHFILE